MRNKVRWTAALTLVAALGITLWLVVPLASGGRAAHRASADPCQLARQPASPLEENTVTVDSMWKTVVMEKEVFTCSADPAAGPSQIRDLETFIEIVELATRDGAKVVDKRVEAATCVKSLGADGVSVKCGTQNIPLEPPGNPAIPGGCIPAPEQPADPVEMNTAVSPVFVRLAPSERSQLVKTIKVEKEVFNCQNGLLVADLYLFTEIIEAQSTTSANLPTVIPIAKQFEGIVCFKDVPEARLVGCRQVGPLG